MTLGSSFGAAALAAFASAALSQTPALAQSAEAVTVDAISVWSGSGTVIATWPSSHAFAGEMSGHHFVDAGEGPVSAGHLTCGGALESDEATGRQTGAASCRLQAVDGAVAYGRFTCEGFRLSAARAGS